MDYTKSIGNITELQCLSKFIEMGFDCSIPYGDCCKYDFIADLGCKLIRVQCKTSKNPIRQDGTRDTGSILFTCVTQTTNTKRTVRHKYTEKDIDYFATYWNGNVYLVPVNECSTTKTLRFLPPMNNQSNYNKAEDYLIENVLGCYQSEKFLKQKNKLENQI